MIVFDGLINGVAEKYFFRKSIFYMCLAFYIGMLVLLPVFVVLIIVMKSWVVIGIYGITLLIFPLFFITSKSSKEKKNILPKKIVIQNDVIICVTDKTIENKNIDTVKKVNKFDEFYEIVFQFGNISEKFICQKSLLVKGSIEEFEKLFAGKIVDKTTNQTVL